MATGTQRAASRGPVGKRGGAPSSSGEFAGGGDGGGDEGGGSSGAWGW